jgi:hypothetical protein
MNLFYYGRVFAGGDAKLLFAMTAFFLASTFWESVGNIGIFLLILMISGSVYGLIYSFVLWFKNKNEVNKEMARIAKSYSVKTLEVFGVVLMLLGFVESFFFLIGVFVFVFPLLYVFAKGLENVSMVREISGKELREGDWLVDDVKVGRRIVKADWEGLSLEDIKVLKGKRVLIKEGLPFVPAFLIAFLGYVFLKNWILGFFMGF